MFRVHGKHIYAGRNFQEVCIEAHATVTLEILSSFPGIHNITRGYPNVLMVCRSTKLSTQWVKSNLRPHQRLNVQCSLMTVSSDSWIDSMKMCAKLALT